MTRHSPCPTLTDELIEEICGRVKLGAFDHVAAGAVGVPPATFDDWLRRGRQPHAGALKRRLVLELHKARAHARLMAETNMRSDDPKVWLLHGPGKETATRAGWSAQARAAAQADQPGLPLLQRGEFAGLTRLLMKLLAPYPEARAAVAGGLAELADAPADPEVPAPPPDDDPPPPLPDP